MEPTTAFVSSLSDGIGYQMFFYSFMGSFVHMLYKLIHGMHEKITLKEPFYFIGWLQDNALMGMFSTICGLLTIFGMSEYWPPVTVTKSIIAGLLAGSAVFNLLPVVTSGDMWKSLGQGLVDKIKSIFTKTP